MSRRCQVIQFNGSTMPSASRQAQCWRTPSRLKFSAEAHSFGELKLPSSQTMLISHCRRKRCYGFAPSLFKKRESFLGTRLQDFPTVLLFKGGRETKFRRELKHARSCHVDRIRDISFIFALSSLLFHLYSLLRSLVALLCRDELCYKQQRAQSPSLSCRAKRRHLCFACYRGSPDSHTVIFYLFYRHSILTF